MSERGTFEYAAEIIKDNLGQSIGKILGGSRVLFRDVDTGRFSFSTDIWTYFRENYEELKITGAFG